jgi:phosphohistidine swiveling domain-containing protein
VEPAQGHVRLLEKPLPRPEEIAGTDVLVVQSTGREHVPLAKRAAGIIVVDGGMESHAARMALELGLTAIVGATDALSALHEGASVTLDPQSGRVYEGRVRRGSFAAACEKMIE